MHAWHCGVRQAMLPIGNAFCQRPSNSPGLSSLSSPFREIKSTVQHRSYRLSSVQGWEGGGKEIHRSVIEELSEIFQRPNEKEMTACLQSCNVHYIHGYAAYSFRCCCYSETSENLICSGPSRVPEWLDWSHWTQTWNLSPIRLDNKFLYFASKPGREPGCFCIGKLGHVLRNSQR